MRHSIKWTTGAGSKVETVVELITEKTVYADGYNVAIACCDIQIVVSHDGEIVGYGFTPSRLVPGAVALAGRLPVNQANYDRVCAAIAACKATPQWIAKEAAEEAAALDNARYDREQRAIEAAMAE